MASRKTRSYPKTNALAFSKVNCHSCLRLEETCDRQRPRCRTCKQAKRICGGYAMDLRWKNGSFSNHHSAQVYHGLTPAIANDDFDMSNLHDQSFRFVNANCKRRRRNVPQNRAFKELTTKFDASSRSNQKQGTRPVSASRDISIVPSHSSAPSPGYGLWSSTSNSVDETVEDSCNGIDDTQISTHEWPSWPNLTAGDNMSSANNTFAILPNPDTGDGMEYLSPINSINLNHPTVLENRMASSSLSGLPLSPVLFNNHIHKWGPLLDMYNQEFCVWPLTQDCLSNPFRIQKDSCEGSDFLLHAVLALASQHIAKKDRSTSLLATTLDHQATALTLFRQALTHTSPFMLLDTILLLVNFEATQSASSSWSVHLNAALKILDSIGISKACQRNSRTRAQIAMLIWWDTTLSFISRKDLVFPLHYLQTLMQSGTEDGWTYFQLNGCPADLLMFMARFAKLASIYVKAEPFGCFNDTPVQQLVNEVQNWENPEDGTASDVGLMDVDPNSRRDRFHCIEAWRHAILIYARRVFTKKQSPQELRSITYLARVILDHVRCIPDTKIVQKQTLLPVFLAAAEVEDPTTRSWVRSYCDHWTRTARYDMFGTTAELLELIWADWLPQTRDVYWWGCKIGHNSNEAASQSLVTEILLG